MRSMCAHLTNVCPVHEEGQHDMPAVRKNKKPAQLARYMITPVYRAREAEPVVRYTFVIYYVGLGASIEPTPISPLNTQYCCCIPCANSPRAGKNHFAPRLPREVLRRARSSTGSSRGPWPRNGQAVDGHRWGRAVHVPAALRQDGPRFAVFASNQG